MRYWRERPEEYEMFYADDYRPAFIIDGPDDDEDEDDEPG